MRHLSWLFLSPLFPGGWAPPGWCRFGFWSS